MNNISKRSDKLIGVPLLFTLGALNADRQYSIEGDIRSAAFLCLSGQRDIIMALPLFIALKSKYPECKVTVFTVEDNIEAASISGDVDVFIKLYPKSRARCSDIIRGAGCFDLWIDLGVWSRFEALLSIKAKARYKIGFKTDGEMRHFAYDRITEYDKMRHRAENIAKLARVAGLKIDLTSHAIEAQNASVKPKSVVINMFADDESEKNRLWPFENWKALVESLAKKEYKISLIGDKSNASEADKFSESLSSSVDMDYLVGRLDIQGMKKLLSESEVLVSVDALPLYVARYIGTNAVGIFGPTYPRGTYFNAGKNEAIVAEVNCIGCQNVYGDEKCMKGNPVCMQSIPYEAVEERIMKICGGTK